MSGFDLGPLPHRIPIEAEQVRRLVATQFPQWADLPVERVAAGGWDNATFHLGPRMSVRLPTAAEYTEAVDKEHQWLPLLAPQLPLPIPTPLAKGAPGEGYPYSWSIYQWLDGETARPARIADQVRFGLNLAEFVAALQRVDPANGPRPARHNWYRGGSLRTFDAEFHRGLTALTGRVDAGRVDAPRVDVGRVNVGEVDVGGVEAGRVNAGRVEAGRVDVGWVDGGRVKAGRDDVGRVDVGGADVERAAEIWQQALDARWTGAERWFHGDLAPGNLLLDKGHLAAVIDFGTCGVGDPACDLAVAWTLLTGDGRRAFRERLAVDDATWARGRGWALWKALVTYADALPEEEATAEAWRVLDEILA